MRDRLSVNYLILSHYSDKPTYTLLVLAHYKLTLLLKILTKTPVA